jgi:hypothetical protein
MAAAVQVNATPTRRHGEYVRPSNKLELARYRSGVGAIVLIPATSDFVCVYCVMVPSPRETCSSRI